MGVFSDLASNAKLVDFNPPANVGGQRPVACDIDALRDRLGGDADYPAGYDAANEVQVIGEATGANDGTYTVTVELANGESFTTAAIDHDGNAAAIQSAIDTAADGEVTGYTAGDITVSGGPLDSDNVILTFDGDSVSGANHPLVTVDDASLIGGTVGTIEATTEGQAARWPWALLKLFGVTNDLPSQGENSVLTRASNVATNPYYPDQETIRVLAKEAAIADGNDDVEAAILTVAGLSLDGR